jgi:hypothetical protein
LACSKSPKHETAQVGDIAQAKEVTQGNVVFLRDKIAQSKIAEKLKKYRKKDAIAQAIKEAIAYEQEHEKLPTKRDLMDLAGCTDHQAKEALKIIREVTEELEQTG